MKGQVKENSRGGRALSHLWKSLGQKRTTAIRYDASPQVLSYLSDLREATRMALSYVLVDTRLNAGKIPSPIRLRKKVRPRFVSSSKNTIATMGTRETLERTPFLSAKNVRVWD